MIFTKRKRHGGDGANADNDSERQHSATVVHNPTNGGIRSKVVPDTERGNAVLAPNEHTPLRFGDQLKAIFFSSWINLLLLAVPVGITVHFIKAPATAIFVINFIAIIPLAAVISFATEEIALRIGETLGGLVNATFGSVHFHSSQNFY